MFASSYSLKNIERAQAILKKKFEAQGFAHIDIKTNGVIDFKEHVVDVFFDVQFHKKKTDEVSHERRTNQTFYFFVFHCMCCSCDAVSFDLGDYVLYSR